MVASGSHFESHGHIPASMSDDHKHRNQHPTKTTMKSTHCIIIAVKSQHMKDITTPHPAPHHHHQQQVPNKPLNVGDVSKKKWIIKKLSRKKSSKIHTPGKFPKNILGGPKKKSAPHGAPVPGPPDWIVLRSHRHIPWVQAKKSPKKSPKKGRKNTTYIPLIVLTF